MLGDALGFFNQNGPAITAFTSVVIAVFTIVLGVFTVSVARSTRMAAEASIAADLPRVRLNNLLFKIGRAHV